MSIFIVFTFLLSSLVLQSNAAFDTYYAPLWGGDHLGISPDEVTLLFDQEHGGAGFRSKAHYRSGYFHIRMKIPDKPTGGLVTNFYLTSAPDNVPLGNHFELDFEFLGTNGTLQTNVYLNEINAHREQSFNLWFNPSQDFHTYEILWNSHQIVFYIDQIPVRVFKNMAGSGIPFPNVPMQIEASIWDADWAGAVDWANQPFIAHYQDFDFTGCIDNDCDSESYFYNGQNYWDLSAEDKQSMDQYRSKYMSYDYCSQPSTALPECSL